MHQNPVKEIARSNRGNRVAVILAGGDGSRLKPLTKLISGDERPKQFCPIVGNRSLLPEWMRAMAA